MSAELCPACGSREVVAFRVAHQVVAGQVTSRTWPLRRCGACGTAALAAGEEPPTPELYETGAYEPVTGARERALEPVRGLLDRERLRRLGPLPRRARVIEVGAGSGRLVAALRARGHDAVGIEPSRTGSAVAAGRGLPIERRRLEEVGFPPGEADLIVLWHVLEHLDRPGESLGQVRPWLRPEGRLVVAVPNLSSLQAGIGGDRWFHQDVPRHRTHFTVAGLDQLLRRSGFAPTGMRQTMVGQNWLGMWLTLLNHLTAGRDVPFRFLKRDLRYRTRAAARRDAIVSILAGIPLIPIAVALELVAGLAGRGGTVVAHASPA